MNYLTQESPMAKIAIDKSLLKEYSTNENPRTVYMQDGDEFQIQLFNNKSNVIAAEIIINGVSLNNKIVLKPGERIWLERYLNSSKKFKFSTYDVEDTPEVRKAISNNGLIEIKFYDENNYKYQHQTYITNFDDAYDYYNTKKLYTTTDNYLKTNISTSTYSKDYNVKANYIDTNISDNSASYYAKINVDNNLSTAINSVQSLNANVNSVETAYTYTADTVTNNVNDSIETGRIEEGSYSNQTFENVYKDFSNLYFNYEKILILPISRKLVSKNDLQKVYCTECGRKLNPKYKYCPYCGTKCEQLD